MAEAFGERFDPMMFMTRVRLMHVQRHLGGNPWQCLHQEVCGANPGLNRPEWVLDRLASSTHCRTFSTELANRRHWISVTRAC